jgi:hypothetical protein
VALTPLPHFSVPFVRTSIVGPPTKFVLAMQMRLVIRPVSPAAGGPPLGDQLAALLQSPLLFVHVYSVAPARGARAANSASASPSAAGCLMRVCVLMALPSVFEEVFSIQYSVVSGQWSVVSGQWSVSDIGCRLRPFT